MTIALPDVARTGVPILGQPKPAQTKPTRLFGWLADQAGCGYYRIALPFTNLPQPQFIPAAGREIPMDWFRRFDTIVGQRICKPGASSIWQQICRDPSIKAIYEIDDDLWRLPDWNPAAEHYADPDVRAHLDANIAAADLVTVSTAQLADVVRPLNPRVVVIPNYIDAAVVDLPCPEQAVETVTIGWAGSPTHAGDWVCADQVARLVGNDTRVRLLFVGARFPAGLPRDRVTWVPWQTEVSLMFDHLAMRFDIGLAPLAHNRFNTSKSHLKALEYAALGIPVVASAEPPYEGFVRHGETGYLVRQPHEWGMYLRKLVGDRGLRTAMGQAAREQAKAWTIQGNIDRWAQVLAR